VGVQRVTWEKNLLTQIINQSHLMIGDDVSAMMDQAVQPWD
jgi:hypothetical protein